MKLFPNAVFVYLDIEFEILHEYWSFPGLLWDKFQEIEMAQSEQQRKEPIELLTTAYYKDSWQLLIC